MLAFPGTVSRTSNAMVQQCLHLGLQLGSIAGSCRTVAGLETNLHSTSNVDRGLIVETGPRVLPGRIVLPSMDTVETVRATLKLYLNVYYACDNSYIMH